MLSLARVALRALLTLVLTGCATAAIDVSEDVPLPERAEVAPPGKSGGGNDGDTLQSADASAPSPNDDDDAGSGDAGTPNPAPNGQWAQANGEDCAAHCASRGALNVASPEGAKCTSGENIPQSAITAGIKYDKCFPNCAAHLAGPNATSVGKNCYADGQKRDGDSTDVTRGCFCR